MQEVKISKVPTSVTVLQYPCSNPKCLTVVVVRSLLQEGDTPPWIKKALLSKEDTIRYLEGVTDRSGSWTPPGEPAEVSIPAAFVTKRDPWFFIESPELEATFPKQWTRSGRSVKTRGGTAQAKIIQEWFKDRGVKLVLEDSKPKRR